MNEQNNTQDFFASEMLADLKAEKERVYNILEMKEKQQFKDRVISLVIILLVVASFLLYMFQYDYVSYETNEADGMYALIDSEGNVIAADLDQEILDKLMEAENGYGEENERQSSEAQVAEQQQTASSGS